MHTSCMSQLALTMRSGVLAVIALTVIACGSDSVPSTETESSSANQPHIVVMVADDLGVGYAPCLSEAGVTPFLESKCDESVVFDRAYTHPVCTPSRAAMMTGRDTFRTRSGDVKESQFKLGLEEVVIPEAIKQLSPVGYQTAAFGKWHLSSDEVGGVSNPNLQGFDHFEGSPRQHHTYLYTNYDWFVNGSTTGAPEQTYKTTHIVNRAAAYFSAKHESAPQFMWLGFVNPHLPFHLPPRSLHDFDSLEDREFQSVNREPENPNEIRFHRHEPRVIPYYKAMVQALDTEIARLANTLREQSERPIVFVFLGDNGDSGEVRTPETSQLRGFKGLVYEAGIRVPLMIWSTEAGWADRHAAVNSRLTVLADLFPSLTELAGVSPESLATLSPVVDGRSFAGLINRELTLSEHDSIYVQRGNPRQGPFAWSVVGENRRKLILREFDRSFPTEQPRIELFDLSQDSLEQHNLIENCAPENRDALNALYADLKNRIRSEPDPYGNPDFARFDEIITSFCEAQ